MSDRIRRLQAEHKLAVEASRFTRHEVKNGLLAGIYQCDSMKDKIRHDSIQKTEMKVPLEESLGELEVTLHDVLETVLSEAMAREVVHER